MGQNIKRFCTLLIADGISRFLFNRLLAAFVLWLDIELVANGNVPQALKIHAFCQPQDALYLAK